MIEVGSFFDAYGRRARLYPALLTVMPAIVVLGAWLPTTSSLTIASAAVASSFGVFYALASFARTAGKRTERRLQIKWGGWPTTSMLRHRDARISATTLRRYHAFLQSGVGNLPTPAQEDCDPKGAD